MKTTTCSNLLWYFKGSKRQFSRNQKDFRIKKHRINEEIKLLGQWQERRDKKPDSLQAKAAKKPYKVEGDFEKFLHNTSFKVHVDREFLASLSSSPTEDFNFEEKH